MDLDSVVGQRQLNLGGGQNLSNVKEMVWHIWFK